ncbi:MAG: FISUMP domain-containing protein [Bacteroidales bacterium]|nr:FISUMP domain-containing protein [Bacteroidales bacterium]
MKQFLLTILLFVSGYTFAQTLYTHNGAIPITEDSITFKAGKFRGTIQWQYSSDAQDWINIEDEVSDSLIVSANDAGYYRAEIQDGICHQVYSDTALISSDSKNEIGTFTDSRDGKTYKWVKIGKQVWMAENLAYLPAVSTSAEGSLTDPYYYVYGYEGTDVAIAKATSAYSTYGTLYNWPAAIEACPSGWHLPNENEWATLAKSLGGTSVAGFEMKTIIGWGGSITNSTNSSAFSALPGGSRNSTGGFFGTSGNWWSDPLNDHATEALSCSLYPNVSDLISQKTDKKNGFSVRCVKDTVDVLVLTVTVPESVDANAVTLSFPTLKYNKKLVFSFTTDDTESIWNNIFSVVNKKYVSNEIRDDGKRFFFHSGMISGIDGSNGSIPDKFLENTDGCGVKHRFATSVAAWWWYIQDHGWTACPWLVDSEVKYMQDFGFTLNFHDLEHYTDGVTQAEFDSCVAEDAEHFEEIVGRKPKIMIEPNGDINYSNLGWANPAIQMQIAQNNGALYHPFLNSLEKENEFLIFRDFWSTSDEVYIARLLSSLQEDYETPDNTTKAWRIGGSHRTSQSLEASLLRQIETLYGATGSDEIWVPSTDEFFEYWFMRQFTVVKKVVSGRNITFSLYVPTSSNFWFRNLTCLLSNISSLEGVSLVSSANCPGTSYAIKNGSLMVNLDFNTDLLTKVEKYVARFEASLDDFDYEDAQYFVQQLKAGIREPYQARIGVLVVAPVLTSMAINAGASGTESRDVSVTYVKTGTATHYMISESSDFTGASWIAITDTILFNLSVAAGEKTVYLKLKNSYGESTVVSDAITYSVAPFSLSGVIINSGAAETVEQTVTVAITATGENPPTQYKISEVSDLAGASWQTYSTPISFVLSTGYGEKTVYIQITDGTNVSNIVSDSIVLTPRTIIVSLLENNQSTPYQTLTDGTVVNRVEIGIYEGWDNFILKDITGTNVGYNIVKPSMRDGITSFNAYNWSNPTLSGDTGIYPDALLVSFALNSQGQVYPTVKAGMRFIVPAGTYTVRILPSSQSTDVQTTFNSGVVRIETNGIVTTPSGMNVINNVTEFIEITDIVVAADGYLSVIIGTTTGASFGCNLIKIIKTS